MTIFYQNEYVRFIERQGVGANDIVANSIDSYLSYLSSVSRHLGIDITPETLNSEANVQRLAAELDGVRKPRTIGNYISAMRHYVAMVEEFKLANLPQLDDVDFEGSSDDALLEEEGSVDDKHFLHSSFREKLLEHLFVAELLKRSWKDHSCDLEIAKPEADSKGYDLIAENKGVVRHIQLKSTKRGGNASAQNIHAALGSKPSGCVIWLEFDENTLDLGPFRFLGGAPGCKLPPLDNFPIAKHTKANAEGQKTVRPKLRRVSKKHFELIETIDDLYSVLFGRQHC